jgi:hypothetical protein
LVTDDEGKLDDLRLREMFAEPQHTFIRNLEIIPDRPLGEIKRSTFPLIEVRAFSISQNISQFPHRDTLFHANGVADVHSIERTVGSSHLHIKQCAKLSVDFAEPFDGAV